MERLYFSSPQILWLIPVLLGLGLIYLITRARGKILVASRLAIVCLIIAAASNPYIVSTQVVKTSEPIITILADRTGSMSIFDIGIVERLKESLPNSQVRAFSGNSTPLGDKILQSAVPGSTLVLVSDGYCNKGLSIEESLSLAKGSNTTVFAIRLEPSEIDASVEISGTNTAVAGGDYPFSVIVRSSGDYQGLLSVYSDDKLISSEKVSTNSSSSLKISTTFFSTGTHILKAVITSDSQPLNNAYQKAVYVVPKPSIMLIASDASPLATVLSRLYKLTQVDAVPQDFSGFKAIVIDNRELVPQLADLNGYIRNGGGLVVVGGKNSYDLGGYLNSTFEEILPIRSQPSTFQGGKTMILVLDISLSTLLTRAADGTSLLDYEKSLAIELLKSPDFQDYKVGVVVFGTKAYMVSPPMPLARGRQVLEERISSLSPSGSEDTYLDNGLELAWNMLNASEGQGEIIVLSDGDLKSYEQVFQHSAELISRMNITIRLIQVQTFSGGYGRFGELAAKTGAVFSSFIYPSSLTTRVEDQLKKRPEEVEPESGYSVSVVNQRHYITSDLDLNVTITGFNDVTPKSGSQKLVALSDGKPVLTAWRYGLGRVGALSTDNGVIWASPLYSAPNSRLITSTVNWAVGDPRPETNRIDSEDGWSGSPLKISIQSATRPVIDRATVERVAENKYSATLNPDKEGILYLGDYGIAVNYPLEYKFVGFNPELSKMIMSSGGRIFTESEARQSLAAEARLKSQMVVQERTSQRHLLLLIALIIFLVEIIGRRLKEIRGRGIS